MSANDYAEGGRVEFVEAREKYREEATVEKTIVLTEDEFNALNEYSTTLPTGTTIGKRWKCGRPWHKPVNWFMGEYTPDPEGNPKMVGIKWTRIVRFADHPNVNEVLSPCDA